MPTNTAATNAREYQSHQTHYLRKTVNYNDPNIATGIPFSNYLPKGAQILDTYVNIITAFNAGTTNVLTVGQNASSYNDIVGASDVDETAVAMTAVLTGGKLDLSAGEVQPYVKYAQTGTAATAGKARIVITYALANNDG